MRIAQLSSNVESVPPSGYGGTELVVSLLTEGLVAHGHEVTLFSVGNSKTSARLVSVVDSPVRTSGVPIRRWPAYDILLLMKLRDQIDDFDIVHNHMGWQALPVLASLGKPVLSTNHNNVKDYCAPIYMGYRDLPYVAISQAYRQLNYPEQLNYVATIYNGIDVSKFEIPAKAYQQPSTILMNSAPAVERSYLLFIGRLCEDKGCAEAIEIAERLGLPLILAGKVDAADQKYFDSFVKPHLKNPNIDYIGEVNLSQKVELYTNAIATVYPINFDEPFGLVMAESLASGTPVMAFERGSVLEVLSDGETAIIGRSIEELVRRFPEVAHISPSACRDRARRLFSQELMVDNYVTLYQRLVGAAA